MDMVAMTVATELRIKGIEALNRDRHGACLALFEPAPPRADGLRGCFSPALRRPEH